MTRYATAAVALAAATVAACGPPDANEVPTGEALTAELVSLMEQGALTGSLSLVRSTNAWHLVGSVDGH